MSDLCFTSFNEFSIDLYFATYSFRLQSQQSKFQEKPVTQLFFQRFSQLHEYPPLPALISRLCAQVEIPNFNSQSDYQQIFFSTLHPNNSSYSLIVAEAIDEHSEFVYLLIDQNKNQQLSRLYEGLTLEVFKFHFNEIYNISSNLGNCLRNTQLMNVCLIKQYFESLGCYEFFKISVNNWQAQVADSELKLSKKIEEIRNLDGLEGQKKVNEVGKKRAEGELYEVDCLLCVTYKKNVVFLPCGHVVACKVCATQNMQIELGKSINQRRTPRNCPVCVQPIKEAREVFI